MKTLILFLIEIISLSMANGANRVLHYDPAVVELRGIIETQTFPGPPNYESIKNGDTIEGGRFLRLDHAIDVLANNPTTDLGWKAERNVKILHMVIMDDQDWKKVKDGKKIKAVGKLFNRQTGHHHSRVLIEVERIEEVKE